MHARIITFGIEDLAHEAFAEQALAGRKRGGESGDIVVDRSHEWGLEWGP